MTKGTDMDRAKTMIDELENRRSEIAKVRGKEISDAEFCREFLPYSSTTWSRVKAGTYSGDIDRVLDAYAIALDEMDARLPGIRQAAEQACGFMRTTLARAVLASAVKSKDAKMRRITVALAPTGAGKTAIGRYMESRGAVYVEGRKSWRNSYKAFCADVAEAAGRQMRWSRFSEREAESSMLTALRARAGTLYIDEANTLGASTLDALKLIINQSGQSIVIAAVPTAWDALADRAEEEMLQLLNRCQPVIRYSCVSDADAASFMSGCGLQERDLNVAAHVCAEAASKFGGFTLVESVCDDLRGLSNPTMDDLNKIIAAAGKSFRAAGVAKQGGKK